MIVLLTEVIETLDLLEIPYMLSGSIALNVYTTPRMTRDIDIVVQMQVEDVPSLVKAFQDNFYCYEPAIIEEVARNGMFNLIDNRSSYKIDFIVRKNDEYRITEFERREKSDVLGVDAYIVSIEDLIISKLIWIQELQSEKQIEDIKNLLENPSVDKAYLHHWISKLKLTTFNLF